MVLWKRKKGNRTFLCGCLFISMMIGFLFVSEHELVTVGVDNDRLVFRNVSGKNVFRQAVENLTLDDTPDVRRIQGRSLRRQARRALCQ